MLYEAFGSVLVNVEALLKHVKKIAGLGLELDVRDSGFSAVLILSKYCRIRSYKRHEGHC